MEAAVIVCHLNAKQRAACHINAEHNFLHAFAVRMIQANQTAGGRPFHATKVARTFLFEFSLPFARRVLSIDLVNAATDQVADEVHTAIECCKACNIIIALFVPHALARIKHIKRILAVCLRLHIILATNGS